MIGLILDFMPADYYKKIGTKIKAARKEMNVSQLDLAKELGKSSSTFITLIEAGKRKVSIRNLTRIAKHLGKPLSYFLNEEITEMDPEDLVEVALRSDPSLSKKKQKQILEFYRFIKESGK